MTKRFRQMPARDLDVGDIFFRDSDLLFYEALQVNQPHGYRDACLAHKVKFVSIPLDEVVNKFLGETGHGEHNLDA